MIIENENEMIHGSPARSRAIPHRGQAEPTGILVTAAISLLTVAVLFPVLWRARTADRWLAALLLFFPLLMFLIAVAWVVCGQSAFTLR